MCAKYLPGVGHGATEMVPVTGSAENKSAPLPASSYTMPAVPKSPVSRSLAAMVTTSVPGEQQL